MKPFRIACAGWRIESFQRYGLPEFDELDPRPVT
jgi:hypothetical protein